LAKIIFTLTPILLNDHMPAKTRKYEKPTESLYGSVKLDKPIDDPKRVAREYIWKKELKKMKAH
jgi:hypothetical protein